MEQDQCLGFRRASVPLVWLGAHVVDMYSWGVVALMPSMLVASFGNPKCVEGLGLKCGYLPLPAALSRVGTLALTESETLDQC